MLVFVSPSEERLNDLFGVTPTQGHLVWDWQEALAQFSDPGYAERGELTVTYLTLAHQQVAASLAATMRDSGFDNVTIDAHHMKTLETCQQFKLYTE